MAFDSNGWTHGQFAPGLVANIRQDSTRPIYLVEINHGSTTEYLSCVDAVTYDGQVYSAGGCSIASIKNTEAASIVLPATAARVAEVQGGTWRRGVCNIYYIPALPADSLTFTASEGVARIEGLIDSSELTGGRVMVSILNKHLFDVMCPGLTFNQFCSHIPAQGSEITWEGETQVFESAATIVDEGTLTLGGR